MTPGRPAVPPDPSTAAGRNDPADAIRQIAVQVAAIAANGLTYAEIGYDLDRYGKLAALGADLLAAISGRSVAELTLELGRDSGYVTPKVDVRGVLFDDRRRVLLMQERSDGLWSLPGGWADPFDTPSEAVIREVREESGYDVTVTKLAACWDRDRQGHRPPLPVHAYKLFFLCEPTAEHEPDALETLAVGWFGLDELPPLSLHRVMASQLERMLAHHLDPSRPTDFD